MFNSLANLIFGYKKSVNPISTNETEDIAGDTDFSASTYSSLDTTSTDNNYQNIRSGSVEDHSNNLISIDHQNDEDDEELDDWQFINREDEEEESLPRSDSEEKLPFVEIKRSPTFPEKPIPNSNHHSLLAYHHRTIALRYDGGGHTQSLYVVPSTSDYNRHDALTTNLPAHNSMEESWFMTPPPCFTSEGPVNMETSPFENLLIEHPSMSVYHSIRSAQGATDLDLVVEESPDVIKTIAEASRDENQYAAPRISRNRLGHIEQYKMEYLTRAAQKENEKKERQTMCRGALKRSNKARLYNGRNNRQHRSDMQHCRINSGANNNRKC